MRTEERLHALDAVRAFALLSGIVLHAAMTFMPGLAAFGFPADSSQSPALQLVFYVTHVFRMSLFFFLAGYFGHLMFHRKGARDFVRDRAKRILVPLAAGWLFFGPLAMMLVYMLLGPPIDGAAAPPRPAGLPLAHLWFLYYLALIYVAVLGARALFARLLDRAGTLRARIDACVYSLVRDYRAILVIAAPVAATLYFTPNWILWGGIPSPDAGLTPQWPAMIAFGTAFACGWLAHRQENLLLMFKQQWAVNLLLAIASTVLSLWLAQQASNPFSVPPMIKLAYAASYTVAMWHWVFGLVGAGLRFFSRENHACRYLADASYWMYLAHLPVVFALQLIVLKWPLHWSLKFPLIVIAAVGVLLLSYRYCIRHTFIGTVLHGRRPERNVAQRPAETVMSPTRDAA